MPGLNFIFSFKEPIESKSADYKAAIDKTLFEDSQSNHVLFEGERLLSSITSHDSYPVRTFDSDGTRYCIEGKIYNKQQDQADQEIAFLCKKIIDGRDQCRKELTEWLLDADGEFVILAYNPERNRIVIINDIFGLLPFYIHKTDWGVVCSRNFSFVASLVGEKEFDRIAMAQFMVFRHTIGDRTYLKDVYRPKPAELVVIDANSGDVQWEVLYTFNFDNKQYSNRSVKENAAELAELFTEGCRNRVDPEKKTIVSLSGGLDSRSAATALKRAGIAFETKTFLDVNKIASTDYKIAQQVASELQVDWQPFELKPLIGRNILRVLKMKSGLVYIGKVYFIQMHDKILSDYGNKVTIFMGLGGDRIAHDLTTTGPKKITTLDDFLARSTIYMPFETASRLTGVTEEEFFDVVKDELNSYPEESMNQKCIHFSFYGQTFKWHFEGHDRLRYFFWPASPFFSLPFFKYIMNCPDSQKTNLRLYYYFLKNLNPKISEIPCARNQFQTPIALSKSQSLTWYWYCRLCQMIRRVRKWPNPVRFVIKRIRKKLSKPVPVVKEMFEHSDNLIKCMKEQISVCGQQQGNLNWTEIEDVVKNSQSYHSELLFNLFTITSMVEDLSTGKSTLEKYPDCEFGSFNPTLHKDDPTENF